MMYSTKSDQFNVLWYPEIRLTEVKLMHDLEADLFKFFFILFLIIYFLAIKPLIVSFGNDKRGFPPIQNY